MGQGFRVQMSVRSRTERRRIVCITALMVAFGAAVAAQTADPRLTVADVEKVTGLKGLQLVAPGSVTGAGAGLSFAVPDKHMVPFPLFHAEVPGVGDEAFDSPPG